jgi:hypothetical protein
MLTAVLKEKACPVCRNLFMPGRPLQAVCGPKCAMKKVREEKAQKRAKDRELKEADKTSGDLKGEAQEAFNAYIRYRDRSENCIDCGKPFEPGRPGGSVDAGHFFSRSAAPHLRFNEDNVFSQRKNCNRPGGTTFAAFRAGVVNRIGEERTQAVEALAKITPPPMKKGDYREVRATYRRKLRELKARAA